MNNFFTQEVTQINVAGFLFPPYVLHDATVLGPWSDRYWLVHSLTMFTSNSASFPYSLYLVEIGALQVLKNAIRQLTAASAGGLGYDPAFFGTVAATSQPPLQGIHKIGNGSGLVNDGSFGVFQSQQQLSTSNPESGGTIPNNVSKRKIIVPSQWSLYCVATGNSFGGSQMWMRWCYQEFYNGCKPDAYGYRSFRGAQLADVNELTAPA